LKHSPEIADWLKLINASELGPVKFRKLLEKFGSVNTVMGASVSELTKVDGIGHATAEKIARTRNDFNSEAEIELAEKLGVAIINIEDTNYPSALKEIHDPPPVLYVKGTIERKDALSLAIVGSRRCSLYGEEQASRFAHLLASSGFTIISGMARGIDSAAHRGALLAKGRTIAEQGCGLSRVFPPENKALFDEICQSGACISERPLKTEPLPENFPARNRIIAGLSLGVLVIEASATSGALISAKAALDCNREVMAVPGKIDSPLSTGSHRLIKEGAKLVDCIEDVLEALGYVGQTLRPHAIESVDKAVDKMEAPLFDNLKLDLSSDEKTVYETLSKEPMHIEEIISCTKLAAGTVNASLIALQLKGIIKQLPGNSFLKR
jgi:DNA processing protein